MWGCASQRLARCTTGCSFRAGVFLNVKVHLRYPQDPTTPNHPTTEPTKEVRMVETLRIALHAGGWRGTRVYNLSAWSSLTDQERLNSPQDLRCWQKPRFLGCQTKKISLREGRFYHPGSAHTTSTTDPTTLWTAPLPSNVSVVHMSGRVQQRRRLCTLVLNLERDPSTNQLQIEKNTKEGDEKENQED